MKITALLLMLGLLTYALITSWQWPAAAKIPVVTMAVSAAVLVMVNLVEVARRRHRETEHQENGSEIMVAKERAYLLWVIGYLVLVTLIGFVAGSAVFLFAYLKLAAPRSFGVSILTALAVTFFIWFVFIKVFMLAVPDGIVM